MSVTLSPPPSDDNKLMRISAILAVVSIAHVGLFWAISQMQPPKLKELKKTPPIEVKFVQPPKELPPPPPPPPKPKPEQKKPEPKKPEPKKVEPKKPEPKKEPPKVVEKPKPKPEPPKPKTPPPPAQKVIASQKPAVSKPDTPTVTKREVVKDFKPAPVQDPNQTVKTPPKVVDPKPAPEPTPEPVKKPAPEPTPEPPKPKVDTTTPRQVSSSAIAWKRTPKPSLPPQMMEKVKGQSAKVKVTTDAKGRVVNVVITDSSGDAEVDKKIIQAARSGSIKPYTENGVAVPVSFMLPFNF